MIPQHKHLLISNINKKSTLILSDISFTGALLSKYQQSGLVSEVLVDDSVQPQQLITGILNLSKIDVFVGLKNSLTEQTELLLAVKKIRKKLDDQDKIMTIKFQLFYEFSERVPAITDSGLRR